MVPGYLAQYLGTGCVLYNIKKKKKKAFEAAVRFGPCLPLQVPLLLLSSLSQPYQTQGCSQTLCLSFGPEDFLCLGQPQPRSS